MQGVDCASWRLKLIEHGHELPSLERVSDNKGWKLRKTEPGNSRVPEHLSVVCAADAGFVYVYTLRAAFLGLFALLLIARRDLVALKWFAFLAVFIPLGDFALTYNAGAPLATVIRHGGYVVYILVTAGLLHRVASRSA